MDAHFYAANPFRPPHWRAARVLKLIADNISVAKPRRYDDHYIRAYRQTLLVLVAAGDDENERGVLLADRQPVYRAHQIYFGQDQEFRRQLEARLLTQESLVEIANRLGTDAATIEFFEALFFHVRDRLTSSDWIAKVIRGPREHLAPDHYGSIDADERGFLYRLFAYHGGPHVLDLLIGELALGTRPRNREQAPEWFDKALSLMINNRATAAAGTLKVDRQNAFRLIKLALRMRQKSRTKTVGVEAFTQQPDYLDRVLAAVEKGLGVATTSPAASSETVRDQSTPGTQPASAPANSANRTSEGTPQRRQPKPSGNSAVARPVRSQSTPAGSSEKIQADLKAVRELLDGDALVSLEHEITLGSH